MTTPPPPATVAGRALADWSRHGRFGTWHALTSAAGEPPLGVLRVDRSLLSRQGARERLAAAVVAVTKLRLPGVPATVDLVREAGDVWLIVARPPVRTVADLLSTGAPGLDEGSAASVLNETAQTLLALHAAGLAHGALGPDRVVLAPDGTALLTETALATALAEGTSTAAAQEDDIAAWAALARTLGTAWATPDTPAADLFTRCSGTAESTGLAAARTTLTSGRTVLPRDFLRRTALRTAAATALTELTTRQGEVATAPAHPAQAPAPAEEVADTRGTEAAAPGDQATVLGKRNRGTAVPAPRSRDSVAPADSLAPADAADRTGSTASTGSGAYTASAGSADSDARAEARTESESESGEIVLRFGPGVPRDEEERLRALWAAPAPVPVPSAPERGRRRRRRAGLLGATAVLAATGVALWLLLRPAPGPVVTAAEVRAPAGRLTCDQTADLTGIVTTDGHAGPVTYRWLRSDGQESGVLTRTARRGEHEVAVHLRWTVRGPGAFRGTARLQVLRPTGAPLEAAAGFTYACP
ncbi:hypothetical protein [Streptomyces sp. NPDC053431]|uniref:hypothetical protein n=1 Tax=Streptomyces sp. NPDC053431 TaxID=3365703 RepID=UPI0037D0DB23